MDQKEMQYLKVYGRSFYDFQEMKMEFASRLRAMRETATPSMQKEREFLMFEKNIKEAEESTLKIVENYLDRLPIYTEFLSKIRGCATKTSVSIVTSIMDITKFPTISKLWAYAGLHVVNGRSVKKKRGQMANWNAFLKTKLYVLADCLIKLNFDPKTRKPLKYRKLYDDYKHRIENREQCHLTKDEHAKSKDAKCTWLPNGCTKGHVHAMAMRYVQKIFLHDLWLKWYEIEGIEPPTKSYAEDVLGRKHGEYPKEKKVLKTVKKRKLMRADLGRGAHSESVCRRRT